MKEELDVMCFYMAAEKTQNMINTIEGALDFFEEFKIKPDEEVKGALGPVIDKLKAWLNNKV